MPGTEMIMGMEEVVQHIRELEMREENLKEALAQKFYKHYDQMNYDKLNIARTVGPDLGRMIDHLMAENKRLQEEKDDYDAMMIDAEAVEQGKDNRIESLEEENKKLKEELESIQPDGRCLLYEVDKLGLMVDDEREENRELKEENQKLKEQLEQAKETAYHMGVDIFGDFDREEPDSP